MEPLPDKRDPFRLFDQKIDRLVSVHRPTIAFGLREEQPLILESLKRGQKYADIVLIGPESLPEIEGLSVERSPHPEEQICKLLYSGAVEGMVRGTLDDFKTLEAYERLGGKKIVSRDEISLLQDAEGRRFFLGPGSNPEGWTREERLATALAHLQFTQKWEIPGRVAVLTGVRHETYARKKHIRDGIVGILNQTYEDAEWIVSEIAHKGYEAKNFAIDSDLAVQDGYTIILPVNGMVGNQMMRMLLLSGGKILFGSIIGTIRPIEDNSRNETDFDYHIKWLVARINSETKDKP